MIVAKISQIYYYDVSNGNNYNIENLKLFEFVIKKKDQIIFEMRLKN